MWPKMEQNLSIVWFVCQSSSSPPQSRLTLHAVCLRDLNFTVDLVLVLCAYGPGGFLCVRDVRFDIRWSKTNCRSGLVQCLRREVCVNQAGAGE